MVISIVRSISLSSFSFFFNDTATTEIYTLSLHDALPISARVSSRQPRPGPRQHAHAPRADAPRRQERGARVRPLDPRAPRPEGRHDPRRVRPRGGTGRA